MLQFYINLGDKNGAPVCRKPSSGWTAVREDMHYAAVLRGLVPNDDTPPQIAIEPVLKDGRVAAVAAAFAGLSKTYPLDIFKHEVHELLLQPEFLKKDGEETPTWRWWVEAEDIAEPAARRLRVRVRRHPYPFADQARTDLAPGLNISHEVLEQLRHETAAHLHVERADILCGALTRDALVITSRFPLAHTEATAAHVAFSPLTFQAARDEHLRRATGEAVLGWHHNHPPKCGRDCLAVVPACDNDSVFLSVDDYNVFLASFSSPYMVGLITGKGSGRRADDPIVRAYGWHDGVIREIPFTVFGEPHGTSTTIHHS